MSGVGTVWLYWVSVVPFIHSLGRGVRGVSLQHAVPGWALSGFESTQRFQLVASYGLFRSMTGNGGNTLSLTHHSLTTLSPLSHHSLTTHSPLTHHSLTTPSPQAHLTSA
jgi:hypothetical protein